MSSHWFTYKPETFKPFYLHNENELGLATLIFRCSIKFCTTLIFDPPPEKRLCSNLNVDILTLRNFSTYGLSCISASMHKAAVKISISGMLEEQQWKHKLAANDIKIVAQQRITIWRQMSIGGTLGRWRSTIWRQIYQSGGNQNKSGEWR